MQDFFGHKHTFSPKDLNIYHRHFEKSEKQSFRLNFVLSFSLHEHHDNCAFKRIEQRFNCHSIKAGTYFENPNTNNLDLQVKMCCTPNKLFLGKKDLTAANITYSKIKTFFRCAYLNTLDVFKFYEIRQCCTTNSLTALTLHYMFFFLFVIVHIYKIACNFQCVILVQYYIIHSSFCK